MDQGAAEREGVGTMIKRVLIFGDRNWNNREFFFHAMSKWIAKHGMPQVVIEGCARGADQMAGHEWAVDLGRTSSSADPQIKVEHYPAMWNFHNSYGQECWCKDKTTGTCKGAGPLRNQIMLLSGPDAAICFHTNLAESRGSADMKRRLDAAKIPVWVPFPQPQMELDF
jgi:hypothetical protein